MKLECWIYVTTEDLGDRPSTLAKLHALGDRLRQLTVDRPGLGYSAASLFDPASFEEEDVDRELVESVTSGKLPAIYLNLTYDLKRIVPGDPLIEAILKDYGFRHALTYRQED